VSWLLHHEVIWWPRQAKGQKKLPTNPFALPFGYFLHSLLKLRKIFRIEQQLVPSSSIQLARIKTLANDSP